MLASRKVVKRLMSEGLCLSTETQIISNYRYVGFQCSSYRVVQTPDYRNSKRDLDRENEIPTWSAKIQNPGSRRRHCQFNSYIEYVESLCAPHVRVRVRVKLPRSLMPIILLISLETIQRRYNVNRPLHVLLASKSQPRVSQWQAEIIDDKW